VFDREKTKLTVNLETNRFVSNLYQIRRKSRAKKTIEERVIEIKWKSKMFEPDRAGNESKSC
jgi:CRISPR/Cas system-associated exonuclease Cas4 (RecB family)